MKMNSEYLSTVAISTLTIFTVATITAFSFGTTNINQSAVTANVLQSASSNQQLPEVNQIEVVANNFSTHVDEDFGFSFIYDADLYRDPRILNLPPERTMQSFVDEAVDEAYVSNRRPDNKLSNEKIAEAQDLGIARYETYKNQYDQQVRALMAAKVPGQVSFAAVTDQLAKTFYYSVIDKGLLGDRIFGQGTISETVELDNANTYYNRYGERKNEIDLEQGVLTKYEWRYDSGLGAVLLDWCPIGQSCELALDQVLEIFPKNVSDNGYYIYTSPIKQTAGSNKSLSTCINTEKLFVCFGGTDTESINRAINTLTDQQMVGNQPANQLFPDQSTAEANLVN